MKIPLIVLTAVAVFIAPAFLAAHHGFDRFDQQKTVTLKGAIKDWQWTNPHTWIQLSVGEDGKVTEWRLEGVSTSQLGRQGWKRDFLKVGDEISVEIHPLRNGKPGGQWNRVFDASGREIGGSSLIPRTSGR